jgi:phage gpG-like protein
MVPNVPGIVGDLNRNMNPPKRRFQPRPALVDTGKLRQSISFQVGSKDVVVGTNLEYAAQQQLGGVSKVRLLKSSRKALSELLRKRPELRKSLGWLFSKPEFEVKIRPRRFVGYDNEDRATVRELIGKHLEGQL